MKKERNGFVTFWLVLMICVNVISFFTDNNSFIDKLFNLNYPFFKIQSAVYIVSAILLLCWKEIGFWAIIVVDIIGVFVMATTGSGIFFWFFMLLIKNAILYAILNIRKNGVSTWEYLVGTKKAYNATVNNITDTDSNDMKKCPFCAELIKKEAVICRFCNREVVTKI